MLETFGQRFQRLRKEKGLTQEDIARKVGITAQSVSKLENDISAPDILILGKLAQILGVTTDYLLGNSDEYKPAKLEKHERVDISSKVLKIIINSSDGDKVKLNLPLAVVKPLLNSGGINIGGSDALKNIDFDQIFKLVEQGVVGTLLEINSADGDNVLITVDV